MTTNISITLNGANLAEIRKQAITFLAATEVPAKAETAPTKATKKTAAIAMSEDTEAEELTSEVIAESADDADFMAEEILTPPKKTKAPKLTEKDVNAAAMAHAKANGRPATLALLNKAFKVKSILELKPEQYAKVIETLAV